MDQICAINDDLDILAVQSPNKSPHRIAIWRLDHSDVAGVINIDGNLARLVAVQTVNGKTWALFSTRSGDIKTGHDVASIITEDGVLIAKTDSPGWKIAIDSKFDRVVFISHDDTALHLKVWYPKQNQEDFIELSAGNAFKKLRAQWNH
jgi:hypothetical protein